MLSDDNLFIVSILDVFIFMDADWWDIFEQHPHQVSCYFSYALCLLCDIVVVDFLATNLYSYWGVSFVVWSLCYPVDYDKLFEMIDKRDKKKAARERKEAGSRGEVLVML